MLQFLTAGGGWGRYESSGAVAEEDDASDGRFGGVDVAAAVSGFGVWGLGFGVWGSEKCFGCIVEGGRGGGRALT